MIGQQFWLQTWFNMPTKKPVNKFPWFSEKQIQQLYKDTANVPIEKKAEVQYQLYKEILSQIKNNELKDKKIEAKANIHNDSLEERDPEKKYITQARLRMEDLADQVKDKFNLIPTAPTNEVLEWFSKILADKKIDPKLADDYLNWKSEELLYVSGLKERPAPVREIQQWSLRWTLRPEWGEWNDNLFGILETTKQDTQADTLDYLRGFVKNVGKSAVNLASDVWNMVVNPIDSANNLSKMVVGGAMNLVWADGWAEDKGGWLASANEIADGMWGFLKDRFWSLENLSKTAYEDPVGLFSDLVTAVYWGSGLTKFALKWGAKVWAKAGANTTKLASFADDVGKFWRAVDSFDPANQMMRWIGEWTKRAGGKVVDATKSVVKNIDTDVLVGLDKKTKKGIQNNPYTAEMREKTNQWIEENGMPTKSQEVAKALIKETQQKLELWMQELLGQFDESWPLYEKLKKSWWEIDITPIRSQIDGIITNNGIKVNGKWKLDFSRTAISDTEGSAINRLYNWINETEKMDIPEYLRFRKSIDQLWMRENKKGTIGGKILKEIRKTANNTAHEQIPWLKELDKLYSEQKQLYKNFTEWLVYKDKARYGEWRDNLNQILKNLDTPNRARMAERIEQMIPGITQQVEAINLMPKLIDNYYLKKSRTIDVAASGVLWLLWASWWTKWAILWASLWWLMSRWYSKIKKSRWNQVISTLSDEWVAKLQEIETKIANNKAISLDQQNYLKRIAEKIESWEWTEKIPEKNPKKIPEWAQWKGNIEWGEWKQDLGKLRDWAETSLHTEARKYKSAEEFIASRKSVHRPPDTTNWSRLDDLTNSYWDDIYSKEALNYYWDRNYAPDRKAIDIIKRAKNNPDMEITIYRTVEKWDVKDIRPWDWVSMTKEYALEHWEWPLKWNAVLVEKKVKVKDLVWNADSLQEYWYRPNWHTDLKSDQLKQIREQANK